VGCHFVFIEVLLQRRRMKVSLMNGSANDFEEGQPVRSTASNPNPYRNHLTGWLAAADSLLCQQRFLPLL